MPARRSISLSSMFRSMSSSPICPLSARKFPRSEEHTSELQSHHDLVCRLVLEKKKLHLPPRRGVAAVAGAVFVVFAWVLIRAVGCAVFGLGVPALACAARSPLV